MNDVIFVPGLPASKLNKIGPLGGRTKIFPVVKNQLLGIVDSLTLGPADPDAAEDAAHPEGWADPVEAGVPIDRVKVLIFDAKQARSLYEVLIDDCGLSDAQIHRVGWDWRRPVNDHRARARVVQAIEGAPQGSVLVVHSTGGLLAKAVLAARPDLCARLSAVIAFGVPWQGTLKPLAVLVKEGSTVAASASDAQRVLAHSWAAIDLLPRPGAGLTISGNNQPFDLFGSPNWMSRDAETIALRPTVRARLNRSMATLGDLDASWNLPVSLHNVAGFGTTTTVKARITGGTQVALNVDSHGDKLSFEETCEGDGTVPFSSVASAHGPQVSSWRVPVGAYRHMGKKTHASLWSNPACVRLLETVVAGAAPRPWLELAMDTSAYSPGQRVRLRYALFDEDGSPSADGKVRILSPSGAGVQTLFDADPRGWGMLELRRGDFQRVGNQQRRVVVEAESVQGTTSVFSVIPR